MTEKTPEAATLPASSARTTPALEARTNDIVSVRFAHDDQLVQLLGVKTGAAASGIFQSAMNSLGRSGAGYRDMMAAMAVEMEPRDAVEAMLVSQLAVTHVAMTLVSQKVMDVGSWQVRESFERSMTRLSRTFLAQMDALKKYRAKAQQIVRVERVTVHEGGQAIVGSVRHGGRVDGEI